MSAAKEPPIRFTEGSWFGALGGATLDDSALSRPQDLEADTLHQDAVPQRGGPDSQFMTRQVWRLVGSGRTSVQRIYRTFLGARAALGVSLMAAQILAWILGPQPTQVVVVICAVYMIVAVVMWRLPHLARLGGSEQATRLPRRQAVATVGVDVLVFGVLHLVSGAGGFNYAAMLVLPVLMASVLLRRVVALGVAASAALWILGMAGITAMQSGDVASALGQAGLAGMGFFIVALLSSELAARLAREEQTARGGLEMARQQAQLNRLVIDEMQEGVLVVDRHGRVRAANPAARALLAADGEVRPSSFQLRGVPTWQPLVEAMETAFAQGGRWPLEGRPIVLLFDDGLRRQLQLRMRFTRRRDPQASEDLCVLFVEDVRAVQARARQDKLAAMGRVSAGIAHEIRNPLAAIAQANALLGEDVSTPAQRQLTQMVSDNVDRLKRIVDDVMEVAPGSVAPSPWINLVSEVASICGEWARMADIPVSGAGALKVDLPEQGFDARFDPHHLRRVLVNLLDNALRHGTATRAAIWVVLTVEESRAQLSVFSDGPPIEPEVERYLFEPFFSTRSRGTGLGLYICRELCARHAAAIDFHLGPPSTRYRNEFRVNVLRQESS